ncbi:MAG: PKD domain-containing protein [Phaeodactylibacter sp.]|nr:PKD domain-containing protein [Phaeodactylibacter sp.]
MNDEFIFGRDGSYTYDSNGDFWAEGGVFEPANLCQTTEPANLTGPGGTDLSAFGDGTHAFTLASGKLTLTGLGAFIGLPKIGTDTEVSTPQQSVTLDVIKLFDGEVDTLILESKWKFGNNTTGQPDAYWRVTLVHYDKPGDEPALPDPLPQVGFTADINGLTVTFTNTSTYASSYSWDFGDGNTSTQENPTHTYASAGIYTVKLTATNDAGSSAAQQQLTVTSGTVTEADLVGSAWRIRNAENSIFVGPALGSSAWWGVPPNFLDGSSTGTDDWSCITNDEFIFNADGSYEYKTNGDARNDGYMGSPNGCWSDAEVAASGNGAAFGSGIHSWSFTPASSSPSGRAIITVTNGASGAAFVGFYKGYYGGENIDGANPPNGGLPSNQYEVMSYLNDGTTETLTISVDISGDHNGSAAWTMVLVR